MSDLTVPPLPVVAWRHRAPRNGMWVYFDNMPPLRERDPLVRKADAEAAIASLQARLEAAERDAARYRWLRTWTSAGRSMPGSRAEFRLPHIKAPDNVMRGSVAEHLDAAIDAATSQEQPE